ncbi:MAG: DNA mismatch repair endonuclease MutL [Candidatus Omnitrophica bacterium]|nr:DNA mismatch repair endonuclease MutL [Candidatus Omnitrophota bacterium]
MGKVNILPDEVVAKIAAGEVIERPASVVKELLENSLDAGATSIEISLRDAGKTLIRIKDNGSGIAFDDIEKIFLRHATSKISNIHDLQSIQSLGFRGEALYSIAAVADIWLRSKTRSADEGWQIHVRQNKKLSLEPIAFSVGTEILVQELFFCLPARKKFLKSDTVELNKILETFIPYCLLFPQIYFSLKNNEKAIFDLKPVNSYIKRLTDCLNLNPNYLIEDERYFNQFQLKVKLILGDVNIQRTRKDMQFIFVNGRPVEEKKISFHLNDVYRLIFTAGIYPCFFCFIELPPYNIDVNVHPTKREVKIKDEESFIPLLRAFCEELLMTKSSAKQYKLETKDLIIKKLEASVPLLNNKQTPALERQTTFEIEVQKSIALFKQETTAEKNKPLRHKLATGRYLGNLLSTYLLFETTDSLLILDQHAAQERISFEQLQMQIEKGSLEIEQLAVPITIPLSIQEKTLWQQMQEFLEKLGFQTSLFDKDILAIHTYPRIISNPEIAIRNLLNTEQNTQPIYDMEALARRACRGSVMAGFSMNKEQAEYQKKQLLSCKDPFTCPHGRPTVIEIPLKDLAKQFQRV